MDHVSGSQMGGVGKKHATKAMLLRHTTNDYLESNASNNQIRRYSILSPSKRR